MQSTRKFWSGGYFYRTVGVVTAETVKKYIKEGHQKHWKEQQEITQITDVSIEEALQAPN